MCPGIESATKNEYQGFLLGKRRPVRKADDLPPSKCRTSKKSWTLTYPEPLGSPRPVVGDLYLYFLWVVEIFRVRVCILALVIWHLFGAVSYCHLWPVCLCHIFPHYLTHGTIFWKKLLNIKCVFWFSLKNFSEIFLILRRNEGNSIITVPRTSSKVPVILIRF
jgi:hypothetical protein